MQSDAGGPPNLLADYLSLRQNAVVNQTIETARTSAPLGGHPSNYLCQQDSVFAAHSLKVGVVLFDPPTGGSFVRYAGGQADGNPAALQIRGTFQSRSSS